MANYVDLTADNLLEITDQLDDETLLSYCQTNKAIADLCEHKVWLHRIFKYGLIPLLPQAVLYPSLKEFYLNIRRDAVYKVMIDMKDGSMQNYYTKVQDVYNAVKTPTEVEYMSVELFINNSRYNINKSNAYTTKATDTTEPPFISSFEEILKFPNLEPRSLMVDSDFGPVGITSSNLRKLHKTHARIALRNVEPEQYVHLNLYTFRFGFYDINSYGRNNLLLLLDNSLIDSSDPNYYVVIVPKPVGGDMSRVPILIRSARKDQYSSVLVKYLEKYGTYYKLEDLAPVIREYN